MNLIVAADRNWAIGKDGDLLVHIPEDMKRFRRMTLGKVIVMGRKTLESFPGGNPLPGRVNVVLTRQEDYDGRGALVVRSREEMWEALAAYDPDQVFVVGGGNIYSMLLPYCGFAYVTRLDCAFEADTYMPDLDSHPDWSLKEAGEEYEYSGLSYRFALYENLNVKTIM